MKKFFLIPLLACLTCVMAWAGVAKIGENGTTEYATLNAAFEAAQSGDAIFLLSDATIDSKIVISAKNVTLHMQGYTITNNVSLDRPFKLYGDMTFTIVGNVDGIGANAKMVIPTTNTTSYGFVDYRNGSGAATGNTRFVAYNVDFEGTTDGSSFFRMRTNSQSIVLQDCNVNMTSGVNYSIINAYGLSQCTVHVIRGTYNYVSTLENMPAFQPGELYADAIFQGITVVANQNSSGEACLLGEHTYTDCTVDGSATTGVSVDNAAVFAIAASGWSPANNEGTGYAYADQQVGYFGDGSTPGVVYINSGYYNFPNTLLTMSSGGVIVVKGGRFIGTNGYVVNMHGGDGLNDGQLSSKGLIDISGGEFSGSFKLRNGKGTTGATTTLNISGGTFTNVNNINLANDYCILTIKGGTFSGTAISQESLQNYVPTGYVITANADGSFTVTKQQSTAENATVSWTTASDWNDNTVPSTSSEVTVGASTTVTVGDGSSEVEAKALSIDMTSGSSIVVKNNATLVVGDGGITGTDASTKIVIEEGGQLLISPNTAVDAHPYGSFTYTAQYARTSSDFMNNRCWEHIALPTIGYPDNLVSDQSVTTYLNGWNLSTGWYELNNFSTEFVNNFVGYSLTNSSTTGGVKYTFTGTLVGNVDQTLNFVNEGFTYFANSYTGPIDIASLLNKFETGSDVQRCVYVWDPEQETYMTITSQNVGTTKGLTTYPSEIKPMQAFFIFSHDAASQAVSYEDAVWTPMMAAASAPARGSKRVANQMVLSVISENGRHDDLILEVASAQANADNEMLKLKNPATSVNVYAITENGDMAYLAQESLENLYVGITTNGSASYTLQFNDVTVEGYELIDLVENRHIAIVDGGQYTFTENSNSTVENRFMIAKSHKVATAIENVENTTAIKGVYTITGQYVGEDINVLPAGVYVVDGVKIVK